MFGDPLTPLFPICMIEYCFFDKHIVPCVEIFSVSFPFADFLEESIALSHDLVIVTLCSTELSKCTCEDGVYIFSAHMGREVQEVHVKW